MEKNILLEKIKNSAEQVPVPNGLKPEEILDRLDGMEQEETIQEPFQNKQKKAKKRFPVFKICAGSDVQ